MRFSARLIGLVVIASLDMYEFAPWESCCASTATVCIQLTHSTYVELAFVSPTTQRSILVVDSAECLHVEFGRTILQELENLPERIGLL
jgi:hypothetical protein